MDGAIWSAKWRWKQGLRVLKATWTVMKVMGARREEVMERGYKNVCKERQRMKDGSSVG